MTICAGACACVCVFGNMLERESERGRERQACVQFMCEKIISKIEGECERECLCDSRLLLGLCAG